MRPRGDVVTPDVDEVLHHVRESAQRWQETATRLARQRDHYAGEVEYLEQENHQLLVALTELVEAVTDDRNIVMWGDRGAGSPSVADALFRARALIAGNDPEQRPNPDVARPGEWSTQDRSPDGGSQVPV